MQKIYLTIGKPMDKEKLKYFHKGYREIAHQTTFHGTKIVFVPDSVIGNKNEFAKFILGQIGSSDTVVINEYIRKRNSKGKMQPTPHKIAKIIYDANGTPHWEYNQLTNKEWFTGKKENSQNKGYSTVFD